MHTLQGHSGLDRQKQAFRAILALPMVKKGHLRESSTVHDILSLALLLKCIISCKAQQIRWRFKYNLQSR